MHANWVTWRRVLRRTVALLALMAVAGSARAGDWPQILGPHRDGRAAEEPTIEAWPSTGPRLLWSHELGLGYAGPAVAQQRVVAFHRVQDHERAVCLDAAGGRRQWQVDFPATYRGGVNRDTGPRCVPLIHDGRVYLFGAAGRLHCVRLQDGGKVWSRDAYADFEGDEGYFGAGSTPLVAGGHLLVNVGGADAGLVAFDLRTGGTVWTATSEQASYSSPTSTTVDGRPLAIFVTRMSTVAVDPRDGTVRFEFPFGRRGPTVNAAAPLVCDGHLFVSAAYGVGARFARLQSGNPRLLWQNDEVMSSQYTTCVYHEGHLYGTHGREDYANGELRCLEAKTGKLRWSVPGTGVAHVILVNDRLLIINNEGRLRLARAAPDRYQELASATVSPDTTRALPALSNGRLYFRDNQDEGQPGQLRCLALAE